MAQYDVSQICLNGHIRNDTIRLHPEANEEYCARCGEKTITQCPGCSADIRGAMLIRPPRGARLQKCEYLNTAPAYCLNCGKPYPWTESKLKAAEQLADEVENLTSAERKTLKQSLDELVKDTPNAQVAAIKFKKLVAKAGKGAAEAFKEILISVLSEAVKKSIWQ